MPDSLSTEAERKVQRTVRIGAAAAALLLVALLLAAHYYFITLPNRSEAGARTAVLKLRPAGISASAGAPFRVAAAYRVTSSDARFGGISGVAIDGNDLVAISDSGVVVRFPKPGAATASLPARIAELPAGPGPAGFKSGRDSEAIARDPAGRGWWVAFERRDEVWLYDEGFRRPLRRLVLSGQPLLHNRGMEGLVAEGRQLHLFPEAGGAMLAAEAGEARRVPLHGIGGRYPWSGWVSDAALLPDGRLLLVERRLSPLGFTNALVLLERSRAGYRASKRMELPLSRTDNLEAVAVDRGPDGATRLWLMTDNDQRPFPDTLLMAIDLPVERQLRPPLPR